MKARVLMLTHQCAGRGGSFMRAFSLARALTAKGYDLTLLASRTEAGWSTIQSDWQGVHVLQMPDLFPRRIRNAGLSPLDLVGRLVHVGRGNYDLFHIFDHRPCASLPVLWRFDKRVPVVSDWADLWGPGGLSQLRDEAVNVPLRVLDGALEPYVHRRATALTVISSDLRSRALQLGIPAGLIRLVQVGSNSDLIRPLDKARIRHSYHIPLGAPVVVNCGFTSFDSEMLADMFLLLLQKLPDTLLLSTGAPNPAFDQRIDRAGASQRVRHFGVVPYENLGEVLACGDVMLLPFRDIPANRARFPNRFGDYLAAGRPIATNRVGDHAAIVEEEQIGIATDPDPAAFAEATARLLLDQNRLLEMGARARQLAETRLSWDQVTLPLAELYAELLR